MQWIWQGWWEPWLVWRVTARNTASRGSDVKFCSLMSEVLRCGVSWSSCELSQAWEVSLFSSKPPTAGGMTGEWSLNITGEIRQLVDSFLKIIIHVGMSWSRWCEGSGTVLVSGGSGSNICWDSGGEQRGGGVLQWQEGGRRGRIFGVFILQQYRFIYARDLRNLKGMLLVLYRGTVTLWKKQIVFKKKKIILYVE